MASEARGGGAMADACLVEEEEGLNEWKPERTLEIRDCIAARNKCIWRGLMGLKTRYTIALSPRCCVVEREGGCITRL
jgi:hypothetical protein